MSKEYVLYITSPFEDVPDYHLMAVSSVDKKRIERFILKIFKNFPNKFYLEEFEFELYQSGNYIEYCCEQNGCTIQSAEEFVFEEIPKVKKRRIILKTEE